MGYTVNKFWDMSHVENHLKLYVNNKAQPVLLEISTINNKEINRTIYYWNNWYTSGNSIHAFFGLQIDNTEAFIGESREIEFTLDYSTLNIYPSIALRPTGQATKILDISIPIKYPEYKLKELPD